MRKLILLAMSLFLTASLLVVPFSRSDEVLPELEFADPSYDLVYIPTGGRVPPELYVGYLDVNGCRLDQCPDRFDFRVTINGGIPTLESTVFWTILMDMDGNPENNCQDYPYDDVDTMYSLVYDFSARQWRIERATYEAWGWDIRPTDATWGMTSSWPEGKPVIVISIPLYEMPEILPKTLPWKVVTENTSTIAGDFAPDWPGRFYSFVFSEFMFIEGVFQPVQVVYQQDPLWGDNMSRISSSEWNACLSIVQKKNTLLFGYPYNNRHSIRFNITNLYRVAKTFTLKFWIRPDDEVIFETGAFTVETFVTKQINVTAPLPWTGTYFSPAPFQFKNAGNTKIEVEVVPVPNSAPIQCNKVIVHSKVQQTKRLDIVYVPIALFNGTTGVNLHAPVSRTDAENHASRATDFIKGTYPIAEDKVSYRVTSTFLINHTEVRMTGSNFVNAPWDLKVNLTRILQKLTNYAATMTFIDPGYVRVVALVPDGTLNWPRTYHFGENATHMWHASWKGIMYPDNRKSVFVVSGYWATTAHEIGHTLGLWIEFPEDSEEYNKANPGYKAPGFWVNRLAERLDSVTCFMGTNLFRDYDTRWICKPDYGWLMGKFLENDPEVLLINGLVSRNGNVQLANWYRLPSGAPDIPLGGSGNFYLLFLDNRSRIIGRVGINITFVVKADEPHVVDVTNFAFNAPYPVDAVKIQIIYNGSIVAERVVTQHTPKVTVMFPNGNEILNPKTPIVVTWNASDADGDALTYIVQYTNNSGQTWIPIAVDVYTLSYSWNISELRPDKGYRVRVTATDCLNVGEDSSDNSFLITFIGDMNNDRTVNILDIAVVARSFGSKQGDVNWNDAADLDKNGTVNILDISLAARDYGKTV